MRLFFHWPNIQREKAIEERAHADVDELKQKTHAAVTEANRSIKKFNDLLIENGITLMISKAAGAPHDRP